MSNLSKYYKVTRQILIEYVTHPNFSESDITPNVQYYIYTGLDNKTYYIEDLHNMEDLYSNQSLYLRIPDESDSEYYYPGITTYNKKVSPKHHNIEDILEQLLFDKKIKSYHKSNKKVDIVYDKIRIHLLYGFTLNKLTGFNLQLSVLCSALKPKQKTSANQPLYDAYNNPMFETIDVNVSSVYNGADSFKTSVEQLVNVTEEIQLLDLYFPKELLQNAVKWHSSPIYQNGAFYDRYIEIDVPSAQYIAETPSVTLKARNPFGYMQIDTGLPYLSANNNIYNNYIYNFPTYNYNVGTEMKYAVIPDNNDIRSISYMIPDNPEIILKFSTTSEGNTEVVEESYKSRNLSPRYYMQKYYQDPIDHIAIKYESNSDYFNIRIFEDVNNRQIIYYPVYGEGNNIQDLNIDVMNEIESGAIPMISSGFYNTQEDISEFYELYGEGARKWIIYNDMAVTYHYSRNISQLDTENLTEFINTERFTNVIDYSDKTLEDGQFWRTSFIPKLNTYNNYNLKCISISYTCRLVNRLNSVECIRTATLLISDPQKYNIKKIDVSNITTYKVVNKIQRHQIVTNNTQKETRDKYIRSYYDATDIVISNTGNGTVYTQGQMNLRLKRSSTNYMFRLYYINEDNIRIPYDLTGIYKYKLIFPSSSGDKISINPNIEDENSNLSIGQIVFYINEEQVKRIMQVPVTDRYFAIVTDNNGVQESTLYEGSVSYYS